MEKSIVGQRIKKLRAMTEQEMNAEGWDRKAVAIDLENGITLYPSRDEEGNGAGALFGVENGEMFSVYPEDNK